MNWHVLIFCMTVRQILLEFLRQVCDFYPQERLEPPDEGGFSMGKCRRTGRIAALAKSPPELREERGQQQQLGQAGESDNGDRGRPGAERLAFGHTAHAAENPKAAVVHP